MFANKIVLHFPPQLTNKPIVYKLCKDYALEFNILKALITPQEEGLLVLELKGEEKNYKDALKYLKDEGVKVQALAKDVKRDEVRCTHCGVCVPMCPVGVFQVEVNSKEILFNKDKCIACELCVTICPFDAMTVAL